jgi:acyl carrier protein
MAVEEKVKQIIVEQLQVDEAEVPPAPASRKTWARIRSTWSSW